MLQHQQPHTAGARLRRCAGHVCALLLLAPVLLVSGCASRKQVFQVQEDLYRIRTDLDSLKRQQRETAAALEMVNRDLRDMRSTAEYGSSTLEQKVQQMASRLDEILNRLNRTLAPLEEFVRRQAAGDTTRSAGMGVDYYDAAMRDLSLGNYDLAEVGFLQFLEAYPKNDLADDARYGLAETYYARKNYAAAITEFQRVITMNPQGGKTPAAMLKLGLCQRAQQADREARRTWEDLIKRFPHADEARVAQQRLDELKDRR